ncbi:MAG: three-Cys-motif partner protein TcmP [Anaerohalosphaeraceae bacterium]
MRKEGDFRFDEVGYWSEIKLEILQKYGSAYTTIMSKQASIKGYYYIDGFAGPGVHISKTKKKQIPGSPLIALDTKPPFTGYYFIDLNKEKIDYLRRLAAGYSNVFFFEGDCNEILLKEIFPTIQYSDYKRALCLLDPYGLHLNWEVMRAAGQSKAIEIFLNFPVMDMNRNVLWENPDKVSPEQADRLTSFWGDESWKKAAYKKQEGLFGDIEEKTSNEAIALAFQKRLKESAGFGYVSRPMPMRNENGAVVYYLFFASPNKTGHKIVEDIMKKYSNRGCV